MAPKFETTGFCRRYIPADHEGYFTDRSKHPWRNNKQHPLSWTKVDLSFIEKRQLIEMSRINTEKHIQHIEQRLVNSVLRPSADEDGPWWKQHFKGHTETQSPPQPRDLSVMFPAIIGERPSLQKTPKRRYTVAAWRVNENIINRGRPKVAVSWYH